MRRVLMKTIVFAAAAAALAAGWIFAAPQQIGGSAAYVVVVGSSMEPRLHRGDLAVVRSGDGYAPGDVVAYRSSRLGRTVLHRIERRAGDRYVLKGDANSWLDPDRPSEAQVVGELALRVPAAGRVIEWLRQPLHASLLAGLAAFALLAGAGTAGVRRRARPADVPAPARPRRGITAAPAVFVVAAPLAAIALAATVVAYAQPRERAVADAVAYEHHGSFEYSATARRSPAYDGRRISTGQPIFFRLTKKATFTYVYELETAAAGSVRGSGRLVAQLTDGNGWTRTVATGPRRTFAGDRVRVRLPLDLRRLRGLIDRIEDATGVTRPTYTVEIVPHVAVRGTLAGTSFSDRFGEPLAFQLDGNQLQLPPSSGVAGNDTARRLESTRRGVVRTVDVRPAELSLLGVGVPVRLARVAAPVLALVLLALAVAAAALLVRRPRTREEEPAWIGVRYRVSLLPAAHRAARLEDSVIELETIEALVQVARERGRAILHERHEAGDSYFFEDGGVVYRHRSGEVPAPPRLVPADAAEKPNAAARPRRRAAAK